MEVHIRIELYESKRKIQRYGSSTIKSYKQIIHSFLSLASGRYKHPEKISKEAIEKYILWLIDKKQISQSYQKITLGSITKFYNLLFSIQYSIFNISLNLKHLYPKRTENNKEVSPHILRHSFVAHLFGSGVDIRFI